MKSISIFVVEEESAQQVKQEFKGEKIEIPTFKSGELALPDNAVTLESKKLSEEAKISFRKVQISDETTVFDIIKYCKGDSFKSNSFYRRHYPGYIIEYGYILKRPQIDKYSDEFIPYDKEAVKEKHRQQAKDLGIANNEVLVLECVEVLRTKSPGISADHQITFPPTIVDFMDIVHEHPIHDGGTLHMALLYTDADEGLPRFVRESYTDLHVLSGSKLNVYAIERVNTGRDLQEIIQYWKSLLSEKLYIVWSTLHWLRTKPYSKEQCYEISKSLGVGWDQFPCVALFDTPTPDRVLVFPIVKPYIKFFRSLFEDLNNVLKEVEDLNQIERKEESFENPAEIEGNTYSLKEKYELVMKAIKETGIESTNRKYTRIRERLIENSLLEGSMQGGQCIFNFNGKTFFAVNSDIRFEEISMTDNRKIRANNYYESINTSGGNYIQGNYINMSQDLTHAAAQIQDLIEQLQKRGVNVDLAQEQVAQDIATEAQNDPTMKEKLVAWGQSLGSATISDVVKGTVKLAIRSAGIPLP